MSFILRLESVASSEPVEEAAEVLSEIAKAIEQIHPSLGVVVDVNGSDMFSIGREDPEKIFSRWKLANSTKRNHPL